MPHVIVTEMTTKLCTWNTWTTFSYISVYFVTAVTQEVEVILRTCIHFLRVSDCLFWLWFRMVECCHRLQHHNTTQEQLILLAPCPPPWKLDLLQDRGTENSIPPDVIDAINHRCQRQLSRHVTPMQDESKCVGGCRIGATSAVAVTVLIVILGLLVWKLKSR